MTTPPALTPDRDGVRIAYDTHGRAEDPTLLLIMGLGSSRVSWEPDFVDAAAERGFFVVTFDNRDVGASTWTDTPYRLGDMAADTAALITHLDRGPVHAFGISMGGMITQQLAIDHPETVRSITSVMSTTGDPAVGRPDRELFQLLTAERPTDREAAIDHDVAVMEQTWSPDHWDPERARARARREFAAGINPHASARQLDAILASGDRTEALGALDIPALVVHGRQDRLVTPSGGEATAAAIAGARLLLIDDMAHDLPEAHWPTILDAVAELDPAS